MPHPLSVFALALFLSALDGAGVAVAQACPPISLPSLADCERAATGAISLRRQAELPNFLHGHDGKTVRLWLKVIRPEPVEGASNLSMEVDEGRLFIRFSPGDGEMGWTLDGSYRVGRGADGGYDLELQAKPGMVCPIGWAF